MDDFSQYSDEQLKQIASGQEDLSQVPIEHLLQMAKPPSISEVGSRVADDIASKKFKTKSGESLIDYDPNAYPSEGQYKPSAESIGKFINRHVSLGEFKDAFEKSGTPWDEGEFRRAVHDRYHQRIFEEEQQRAEVGRGDYGQHLAMTANPLVAIGDNMVLKHAQDAIKAGTATSQDYRNLAEAGKRQEISQSLSGPQSFAESLPATAGMVGTAAISPMAMMGLVTAEQATGRALQQGGEAYSPKNLVPAVGQGGLALATYGLTGKIAGGVAGGTLKKVLAGTAGGVGGQQASDIISSSLDEFLPKEYKSNAKFGLLGELVHEGPGAAALGLSKQLPMMAGFALHHTLNEHLEKGGTIGEFVKAISIGNEAGSTGDRTPATPGDAGPTPPTPISPTAKAALEVLNGVLTRQPVLGEASQSGTGPTPPLEGGVLPGGGTGGAAEVQVAPQTVDSTVSGGGKPPLPPGGEGTSTPSDALGSPDSPLGDKVTQTPPDASARLSELRDRIKSKLRKPEELSGDNEGSIFRPDKELFSDVAEYAKLSIQQGAKDFVQWSKDAIEAFGESVKPYLRMAWDNNAQAIPQNLKRGSGKILDRLVDLKSDSLGEYMGQREDLSHSAIQDKISATEFSDPRMKAILEARLEGRSQPDVGSDHGLTRARIQQLEKQALGEAGIGIESFAKMGANARSDRGVMDEAAKHADGLSENKGASPRERAQVWNDAVTDRLIEKASNDGIEQLHNDAKELADEVFAELKKQRKVSGEEPTGRHIALAERALQDWKDQRRNAEAGNEVAASGSNRTPLSQPDAPGTQPGRPGEQSAPEKPQAPGAGANSDGPGVPERLERLAKDLLADDVGAVKLPQKVQQAAEHIAKVAVDALDEFRKFASVTTPHINRMSKLAGNAVNRFLAAGTYAREAAPLYVDKILGKNVQLEQDLKFGSAFYHLRALYERTHGKGTSRDFIGPNLPIKTQAEFHEVIGSKEFQDFLHRWETDFAPNVVDRNYRDAMGLEDTDPIHSVTQIPGLPMNAVHMGDATGPGVFKVGMPKGDLTAPRLRKYQFSKEATLAGEAYDLRASALIENSLYRGTKAARQANMYRKLIDSGIGVRGKSGDHIDDFIPLKDVKLPKGFVDPGDPAADALFIHKDAYHEVRDALQTDRSHRINYFTPAANAITKASIVLGADVLQHTKSLLGFMTTPGGYPIVDQATALWGQLTKDMATRDRLVSIADINALKGKHGAAMGPESEFTAGGSNVPVAKQLLGLGGRFLDLVDRTQRLAMDSAFTRLTKRPDWAGGVEDNETLRRDFINQAGNYNTASQPKLVRILRETGIGAFATAATNMPAQATRAMLGSPGVEAKSLTGAAALRVERYLRMAAIGVAIPMVYNYWAHGRVDGDDKTPFGSVKTGEDSYINLLDIFTPLARGIRQFGAKHTIENLWHGTGTEDHTKLGGAGEAIHALVHPAIGPPGQAVETLVTGKSGLGLGREGLGYQVSNKPDDLWERTKAAAFNLNSTVSKLLGTDRPNKNDDMFDWDAVTERSKKLLQPFYREHAKP